MEKQWKPGSKWKEMEKQSGIKTFENSYYRMNKMDHGERRSADFDEEWKRIKLEHKMKHKEYRKKNGLPTSSDEEDPDENRSPKPGPSQDQTESNHAIKKKLPKELEVIKKQRDNLNMQANNIRREKHEEYNKRNCLNFDRDLKRCILDDCDECQKYKKSQKEDIIFVKKQLPLEMRKIIQSKKILNDSWQEVRSKKNREYHHRMSHIRLSAPLNNVHQQRIQASKSHPGDLEEGRLLQEAIERSRIETNCNQVGSPNEDEEDEFQRAINMSLIES